MPRIGRVFEPLDGVGESVGMFLFDQVLFDESQGAVQFLEVTDLALGRGTNMDEQDRQDGAHVSFRSTIIGEFCANILFEERSLTRTK